MYEDRWADTRILYPAVHLFGRTLALALALALLLARSRSRSRSPQITCDRWGTPTPQDSKSKSKRFVPVYYLMYEYYVKSDKLSKSRNLDSLAFCSVWGLLKYRTMKNLIPRFSRLQTSLPRVRQVGKGLSFYLTQFKTLRR